MDQIIFLRPILDYFNIGYYIFSSHRITRLLLLLML